MEDDGLIGTKHISVGDSEEHGVADLTCSSSDSYSHGLFNLGLNLKNGTKDE